jgi:hypothetical protein
MSGCRSFAVVTLLPYALAPSIRTGCGAKPIQVQCLSRPHVAPSRNDWHVGSGADLGTPDAL